MKRSPKLLAAMEQIKAIIKENDLAAFVILVEPGMSEFLNVIDPSFSCAKIENGTVRMSTVGLPLTGAEKHELVRTTANMMKLLSQGVGKQALSLLEASKQLDKLTDAKHFDKGGAFNAENPN